MSLLLVVDLVSLEHHQDGKGIRIVLPVLTVILDGTLAISVIIFGCWTADSLTDEVHGFKQLTA